VSSYRRHHTQVFKLTDLLNTFGRLQTRKHSLTEFRAPSCRLSCPGFWSLRLLVYALEAENEDGQSLQVITFIDHNGKGTSFTSLDNWFCSLCGETTLYDLRCLRLLALEWFANAAVWKRNLHQVGKVAGYGRRTVMLFYKLCKGHFYLCDGGGRNAVSQRRMTSFICVRFSLGLICFV